MSATEHPLINLYNWGCLEGAKTLHFVDFAVGQILSKAKGGDPSDKKTQMATNAN